MFARTVNRQHPLRVGNISQVQPGVAIRVISPTYSEIENISVLLERIWGACPEAEESTTGDARLRPPGRYLNPEAVVDGEAVDGDGVAGDQLV